MIGAAFLFVSGHPFFPDVFFACFSCSFRMLLGTGKGGTNLNWIILGIQLTVTVITGIFF